MKYVYSIFPQVILSKEPFFNSTFIDKIPMLENQKKHFYARWLLVTAGF